MGNRQGLRYGSICLLLVGFFFLSGCLAFLGGCPPIEPPSAKIWGNVVWSRDWTLWTADLDGSNMRLLFDDPDRFLLWHRFSPDGNFLAVRASDGTPPWGADGANKLYVYDYMGDVRIIDVPPYLHSITWDPTSRYLYVAAQNPARVFLIDLYQATPVLEAFWSNPPASGVYDMDMSSDGQRIAMFLDPGYNTYGMFMILYQMAGGTWTTILPSDGRRNFRLSYSPTRREIVYERERPGLSDVWDIWRINDDGTNPVQLASEPGQGTRNPLFSHDGEFVYYVSIPTAGTYELWKMNRDGSGKIRLFDLGVGVSGTHIDVYDVP